MRPPSPGPLLASVEKPGRYIGGEVNQVCKEPASVSLRWGLVYPDTYEIGMPHQGLRILYQVLNEQSDCWAERCFAPWLDMERELRARGLPLATLESHTPLHELDILGFTLQSELTYTNLLNILDLGGIPMRVEERVLDQTLVVAGGAGAINPEPLADFVDLFLLGDGEEAVLELNRTMLEERGRHTDRRALLAALCERLPFLYAPSLWTPRFDGPALASMSGNGLPSPSRAVLLDLENAPYPTRPVVPNIRTIHDRITIEIMRGCVQSCRFCQAGMEKRPQRFRSAETILRLAEETYRNTGLDEIGLTSLSSSDHPDLLGIIDRLAPAFRGRAVSLSLPSLRVDDSLSELPKRMHGVRRSGLTLAPEVATDRLRRVINKGIANEDLYRGSEEAWRLGWRRIKLYFMIGIPTEQDADVEAIVEMANRVARLRGKHKGGAGQVTASVSTFVPKALTPFQWQALERPEEVARKHRHLLDCRPLRSVRLRMHSLKVTTVEGFLARADRRAGAVLLGAWRRGARFDAWDEHLNWKAWQEAWKNADYGLEEAAYRERPLEEPLPWDHLDQGVTREWLRADAMRAAEESVLEHCQTGKCTNCGVGAATCVDIKRGTGLF